ncbi:hypothetical protein [Pseudoalteromonas sp. Of7M-16]|nr:hypothetical protein [Pseudoalteromonas sp. Of7M-16]MCG7546959.1 hypothetical protein [Pseudoalteromonas sp. Of7M-16]
MPLLLWPAIAGIGGLFVGASLGGFMRSIVKLSVVAAAVYSAYLMWGK